MAGKKAVKSMPMKREDLSEFGMLEIYLLIIIGFIGLLKQFVSLYPLPDYIPFVGSMLVFVIGLTKLIARSK